MSENFFSRWSRRKEAVREGLPVAPEPLVEAPKEELANAPEAASEAAATPAPPSLEDVQSLTPEADFSRFVARDVPSDVKNAAVKKLFADPHFNAMDGLDVYIDDYSKPDPLPEAMLQQLASAHFLKLFSDEDKDKKRQPQEGREVEHHPAEQTVAQSPQDEHAVPPPPNHHAHDADLRLQQDHAAGPRGPGHGTE